MSHRLNPYSTGSNSNITLIWCRNFSKSLNPYSTGSNSNSYFTDKETVETTGLNPYSTGSNSNDDSGNTQNKDYSSLNPYSTGSNSNAKWQDDWNHSAVLILILLEVTQIKKPRKLSTR